MHDFLWNLAPTYGTFSYSGSHIHVLECIMYIYNEVLLDRGFFDSGLLSSGLMATGIFDRCGNFLVELICKSDILAGGNSPRGYGLGGY